MIPEGTLILVELPDREGEVLARVIKCSTQGRSCTLELEDSEEHINVNISKCNYKIVKEGAADKDPSDNSDDDDDAADEEPELDVFRELNIDSSALDRLVTADASELLHKSEDIANAARRAAKDLLDYSAKLQEVSVQQNINGFELISTSAAPPSQSALYVEGFDPEQIWLQLDMLSGPALKRAHKQIKKAEEIESLVPADVEEALDELLGLGDGDEDGEEESDLSDDDGEEEGSEEEEEDDDDDDEEEEEEEDGLDYEAMLEAGKGGRAESDEEEEPAAAAQGGRKRRRMTNNEARAAVEDDFMKLDEMEAFLQQAEREAAGEYDDDDQEQNGDEQIESDSDIDDAALGKEDGDTDEDDSDAEEAELEALLDNAAGLVGRKRKKADGKNKKKKVKFSGLSDSEDDSDDDEDVDLADDPLANATYEDFFGPRKGGIGRKKSAGAVAAKPKQRSVLAEDPDSSEEDDYFNDDDDDDGGMYEQEESEQEEDYDNDDDSEIDDEEMKASKHQRRLEKTASRIHKLEEEAMAEKPWWLQGEVVAGSRPKNSALEIDLDFETTVKPPPAPTEETTKSLEDLIKSRIVDGRFDDPIKFVPPPPDKAKTVVELDDKKSTKGLGELYEQDYVAAVTGVVDDRDAPVRELAHAQFKALSAALDALSHGHYRPVPSIEEVTVKVDVPAIMMEEAAPAFVSAASMRAPEEVYKAGTGTITAAAAGEEGEEGGAQGLRMVLQSGGGVKSEAELTKEDRKRRRAGKKRAAKKKKAAKEEDLAARAAAKGEVRISGRKSEEEQQQLLKLAAKTKKQGANAPSNYSKSAQVFGQLQAQRDGGGIGAAAGGGDEPRAVRASGLKL